MEDSKSVQKMAWSFANCDFLALNDVEICLSDQASNYAQQVLKFKKRKSINNNLPPEVPPLPEPLGQMRNHFMAVKREPPTPLMGNTSNVEGPSTPASSPPSITPTSSIPKNLHTHEGLCIYFKEKLGLEFIEQSDEDKKVDGVKEAKQSNDRIFKKQYENFCLHYSQRVFVSDLEETIRKMKYSIGAIVATNVSDVPKCGATCFRIGTKYVITNWHVVNDIKNLGIKWSSCYVDFHYEEPGPRPAAYFHFRFASNPVIVSSKDLDYAILELNPEGRKLPSSIIGFDSKFNIAPPDHQLKGGECLTFIGHPEGLKKQIDISCPIKRKDDIEEHLVHAFQVLNEKEFQEHRFQVCTAASNPNSAVYDVSTFFKGSSGSPGFLMPEKLLAVLHSRGIPYKGNRFYFAAEEGILMASVVKDVMSKINMQHNEGQRKMLGEIFGEATVKNFYPEKMDIDQ